MPAFGLAFLLDVFSGYVCFGLALYAGCALFAAFWMRRHHTLGSRLTSAEILRGYGGMTLLVLLQTLERLWETFHSGHSRSHVLRIVIPMLYLWLGNSVFRTARQDMGDASATRTKMAKPAKEKAKTAMKSAQTGSPA
jgi:hypothetical protein